MVDFAFNVTECSQQENWKRFLERRPNTHVLENETSRGSYTLLAAIDECRKTSKGPIRLFASSNATSNGTVGIRFDDAAKVNISYQSLSKRVKHQSRGPMDLTGSEQPIELIIWACSFGRFEVVQSLLRTALGSKVSMVRAPKYPLWTDEISGTCVEYLALPMKIRLQEGTTVRDQQILDLVEARLGGFRSSMPNDIHVSCRELALGESSSVKSQRYAFVGAQGSRQSMIMGWQPELAMSWYSRRRTVEFVLEPSQLVGWSSDLPLEEKLGLRTLDGINYFEAIGFATISEALSKVSWKPLEKRLGTWEGRSQSFEFAIPICENDGSLMCNVWTMEGRRQYLCSRLDYSNNQVFRTIT